ncbi:carbonic anhydrase [Vulgatibacter incomptus]|uniref:Carbonic anhydrase 2 n=1 Tax=Vulgatibacter incomptus TaxID=1391653 RepID=A0A0K1PCB4_9BACT|nr:carbonic anhydrase [Vulgatibacter incomptus]AKU91056.1 Carbonic anhydrase [Vulgatibacter incomptus]
MKLLNECLAANREWSARMRANDPEFFSRLRNQQRPQLLWIGCADSRLPPDQIVGRLPGSLFVHRNVGNVVVHSDLNCLSVLQYGIEVLGIQDIIVCGHYGCGGVRAAMDRRELGGVIDSWIEHICDVHEDHRVELDAIADVDARANRLCELNVLEQVANVARTSIVRNAWKRGERVKIHGWVYDLADGLVRDLAIHVGCPEEIPNAQTIG